MDLYSISHWDSKQVFDDLIDKDLKVKVSVFAAWEQYNDFYEHSTALPRDKDSEVVFRSRGESFYVDHNYPQIYVNNYSLNPDLIKHVLGKHSDQLPYDDICFHPEPPEKWKEKMEEFREQIKRVDFDPDPELAEKIREIYEPHDFFVHDSNDTIRLDALHDMVQREPAKGPMRNLSDLVTGSASFKARDIDNVWKSYIGDTVSYIVQVDSVTFDIQANKEVESVADELLDVPEEKR